MIQMQREAKQDVLITQSMVNEILLEIKGMKAQRKKEIESKWNGILKIS